MKTWNDVYMELGITKEDIRLQRTVINHERLVKMCTLAEASDLVEFEQTTAQHAKAMQQCVTWAESGYIPLCNDLLELHGMLFKYGGVYRSCDVTISKSRCIPPHYSHVPMLMRNWRDNMLWWLTSDLDPFEALAEIHQQLTEIHPFSDGNATYLSLPFILIQKKDRNEYLGCLEQRDIKRLAAFFRKLVY